MSGVEKIKLSELEEFKSKSKVECLHSLSHSIVFFLFNQWLKEKYDENERTSVRNGVFEAWTRQINSSVAPVFSGINENLNNPKMRWSNIIEGIELSTEDYMESFSSAIKELKADFERATS